MFSTRTSFQRLLKILALCICALIIIAFAIWRSLNYARGPILTLSSPTDGSSTSSPTLVVRGQALRVNKVTLNGRATEIDQAGNFSDTTIVFPGMNILTIEGDDQFGRSVRVTLHVVGLTIPLISNATTSTQ